MRNLSQDIANKPFIHQSAQGQTVPHIPIDGGQCLKKPYFPAKCVDEDLIKPRINGINDTYLSKSVFIPDHEHEN